MEIEKLVENLQEETCEEYDQTLLMREAADTIERLANEIAPFKLAAAEYGIDAQTMLTLAKSQIATAKENVRLMEANRWIPVNEIVHNARTRDEFSEFRCPICGYVLFDKPNYCMRCGTHIKWPVEIKRHYDDPWCSLPDPPQKGA